MSDHDVSIRARFERFPATVKGAFVVHGEDANPHQVRLLEARVAALGSSSALPVPMKEAVVNVPPHEDMFVPFEFALTELEPGWYELVCDVTVDAAPRTVTGGKRFLIHWPRSTTRRGPVAVGMEILADGVSVKLEQLDCGTDRTTLKYSADEEVPVRILADGSRLPELSSAFADGLGTVECYPLMRAHMTARIEVGRRDAAGVDIELP